MGVRLAAFYEEAKTMGGLKAQMRLAVITGLPSTRAMSEADSPDIITKFILAINELKKEFR